MEDFDDDDAPPALTDAQVHAIRDRVRDELAGYLAHHLPVTYKPRWGVSPEPHATDRRPRSIMLAVAQFWNDQASDEVHLETIGSFGDTPWYPHVDLRDIADLGEHPDFEGWDVGDLSLHVPRDGYAAMQAFAPEGGDQNEDFNANYRPHLLARLRDDGQVEVGTCHPVLRAWLDRATTRAPVLPLDPRVAAALGTHVLADALLEAGDPRGELLAHGVVDRQLQRSWLGALEPHVPRSGVIWRGGVPDGFLIYTDDERLELPDDLLPWAFRPAIRFCAQSKVFWTPGMAKARALGLVPAWLLAGIDAPTEIERLEVIVDGPLDLRMFPRLRELVLVGASPALALPDVAYVEVADDEPARWRGERVHVSMYDDETNRCAGWIVDARTGTIRHGGYHPRASVALRNALF